MITQTTNMFLMEAKKPFRVSSWTTALPTEISLLPPQLPLQQKQTRKGGGKWVILSGHGDTERERWRKQKENEKKNFKYNIMLTNNSSSNIVLLQWPQIVFLAWESCLSSLFIQIQLDSAGSLKACMCVCVLLPQVTLDIFLCVSQESVTKGPSLRNNEC